MAGLGADVAEALRQARRIAGIIDTVSEVAADDAACKESLAGASACPPTTRAARRWSRCS